jgi:hypothetical protein
VAVTTGARLTPFDPAPLGRHRIGFSGTPNDLLPVAVRPCHFEPGSEGKILKTLTSTSVVTVERMPTWTVEGLLTWVANATPPFHALIDVGALVTGFSNEQAARFLLKAGLPGKEAVVFLDSVSVSG